ISDLQMYVPDIPDVPIAHYKPMSNQLWSIILQLNLAAANVYLVPERKLRFFVKAKEDQNFNPRNTCSILRIKIFF
ncbi:MAG: hypothetical protein MUO88_20375, partial [Desulfobacterales bacterium]|nr:hypothetical protein [Desulfobacterales bacterium]